MTTTTKSERGGGVGASGQMQVYYERGMEYVDAVAAKIAALEQIEAKTGVKKRWMLVGSVIAVLVIVTFDLFSKLIASVAGLIYPAYASFIAIESRKLDDNTQVRFLTLSQNMNVPPSQCRIVFHP